MYYFYQDELSVWGKVLKNTFLLVLCAFAETDKELGVDKRNPAEICDSQKR